MASLQLDDYRAATALFDHRHFGRAAASLGVTQPSLTARLRRIETRLGARLFERGRGGVEPTGAGLAFVEAAEDVLRAADAAERKARDAAAGRGAVLRVGFTQAAAQAALVAALKTFRSRLPMVRLSLEEGATAAMERGLSQRSLDVAFIHPPLHTAGLRRRTLWRSVGRRVAFAPVSLDAALVGYPQAEAPTLMTEIASAEEARAPDAPILHTASTVLAAVALARAGYGAALVPTDFRHPLLDDVDRREEPVADLALETAIVRRARDDREVVRAFVDAAVEAASTPS